MHVAVGQLEVDRSSGHATDPKGQRKGPFPALPHFIKLVRGQPVQRGGRFRQLIHELVPFDLEAAQGRAIPL